MESTKPNNMSKKCHFFDINVKHVDLIDTRMPAAGVR